LPRQETPINGLTLFRATAPTLPARTLYRPRICAIFQGSKFVQLGDRPVAVTSGDFFIVTVDLPVAAEVSEASEGHPHLALTFDLDRQCLADLLPNMPVSPTSVQQVSGLEINPLTKDLLDPIARLLELLERPDEIAVMMPLLKQEIHFRLLQADRGALLRQFATNGTSLSQIGLVTEWIRQNYTQAMRIEELAERAGMSVTTLHRHFKTVTRMSPLQYRTQIRLQEARRTLLAEGLDAGEAGFKVGYDSQSQFGREYRRMFGLPPAADAARLRREP
jgi:AraC-like DNA-binding protein